MSPRARVFATVAVAAVAVAGATVTVTWLQARGETTAAALHPRKGVPPLFFDFGLRNDDETRALARGAALLKQGKRTQAEAVFSRYRSVQAQIGAAFARWPDLDRVESIAAQHPGDAVAQLHLGLALFWAGRNGDAVKTIQRVASRFADTPSAVNAEDLLYARDFPGLPYLILPVRLPRGSTRAQQLAAAARAAAEGGAQAKLAYGLVLYNLERRVSARRQFVAAAKLAPGDPTVLTAVGVASFTKRNPTPAFATLGPLTGRFPRAGVVRFHLGLLLLWTRQVAKAKRQLRTVVASQPDSLYGMQARKLLSALVPNGTK